MKALKSLALLAVLVLTSLQLNGCSTMTAGGECAAESMNPTIMATLDSFESAAMSIKLSNRVLLETPLSEQDEWPSKLYGAPSGAALFKMGLSLFGSTQGVTIPTEMDPETGFPRPTSTLYVFLKDRNQMLDKECSKNDISFFKGKPNKVISCPLGKRKKDGTIDDNVYRNPLMAYGVVTGNKEEVLKMQQDIDLQSKGFKQCNAFIHKTTEEIKDEKVKKAACPDLALKDETVKASLTKKVTENKEELADLEKAHGKLANKVYKASVAGADFSTAAMLKIGCAIVNGIRALPNAKNELAGLKGAYNIAMLLPRIKNIVKATGLYKDNLSLQYTVYKTMYQQIKGTYEIKDDEPTKQALLRIENAQMALAEIEPKLVLAAAGKEVEFSDYELMKLNVMAALFPANTALDQELRTAWNDTELAW